MESREILVCLLAAAIAAASCGESSSKPIEKRIRSDRVALAGGGGTPALALVEAPAVKPMRMDRVLEVVDEKVAGLRHSRLGYSYASRPRPMGPDKTEAPYLHVEGHPEERETLPLESTHASVDIAGVMAKVLVTQVFRNRGKSPIEAVYVFPGSTRAAVHGMRMRIGERTVVARIREREAARAEYMAARQAGQRASLLQQERPNVFTMRVANIMPGDRIQVELVYSELLVPADGVYSFVYPSVVGPRNPLGASPKETAWVANPHLAQGKAEPYRFDIKVHLESPIGLKEVSSPSHRVAVTYASTKVADISLEQGGGGNRDYVLRYRLAGDRIESGAMVYDDGKERFFLAMVEPPIRVATGQIPSREYIFVLDVSGSMHGFPLDTAKQLMKDLLGGLRPSDWFNVVLFAGQAGTLHPRSIPASPGNVREALESLTRLRGAGGTDLMDALRTAYALPRPQPKGLSRSIAVITDGYVAVEAQAFRYIQKRLHEANLFSFGIGSSVNRDLIEGMARAGLGSPFVVLEAKGAAEEAARFREYVATPVLTSIEVAFDGLKAYDVVPARMPDLLAQRPLILFGKLEGDGSGHLSLQGRTGSGPWQQRLAIDPAAARPANAPLRVLWARKWAENLMDQYAALGGDARVQEAVTNLGLGYSLLTRFTSFVAVDSEVANRGGQGDTVKQALPLPAGVSNHALPPHGHFGLQGGGGVLFRGGSPSGMGGLSAPTPASGADRAAGDTGLQDLLKQAGGSISSDRPRAIRVNIIRVSNVSNDRFVAYTRNAVEHVCRHCVNENRFTGRLVIYIDPQGKVRITGGSAALRDCLTRRLSVNLFRLTRQSGYFVQNGKPAVVTVTISS